MKYVITGSLGHISKPLTKKLIEAGHEVTVITSNADRRSEIARVGAEAAVGSVTDTDFLASEFRQADAVYLMVPNNFAAEDLFLHQKEVSDSYVAALKRSGAKKAVLLSSVGAHLRKGAGPIDGLGYLEEQLEKLSALDLKILRPSYFYYNLHAMGGLVRQAGIMGSNFGGPDDSIVLTHTDDIAEVAAKHLLQPDFTGQTVEYIASDERKLSEIASVLGAAIGKPETPWVAFGDQEALEGMLQAGLGNDLASRYAEMGKAFREGRATEDLVNHRPAVGKVKLEDFANEFKAVFEKQQAEAGH
jgi:uncharacterized protein YbjT (DUF2867 family)